MLVLNAALIMALLFVCVCIQYVYVRFGEKPVCISMIPRHMAECLRCSQDTRGLKRQADSLEERQQIKERQRHT